MPSPGSDLSGLPGAPKSVVLIHPPVTKPCEPPAGVARLAGALRANGVSCTLIDANLDGLYYRLEHLVPAGDTWSQRAYRHLADHLAVIRAPDTGRHPDRYRRAVADVGRLLTTDGAVAGVRAGLADYRDDRWSPVRRDDLCRAAEAPEHNPYYAYYMERLLPRILALQPSTVGISINYLSQALCAFSLIGLLRRRFAGLRVVIGGGLVTSWMRRPGGMAGFSGWVDEMVSGPGELHLLAAAGAAGSAGAGYAPDYTDLVRGNYLSPGFILPFSASDGCWWRRCAFCPERAEKRPFRPLPHKAVARQLRQLTAETRPVLIHLLDNALSPALLNTLTSAPPGAPWYGFARIGAPLDDLDFCRRLAAAGCVMLKLGLESGSQAVLDRLQKGMQLDTASRVLDNLRRAGIATYVYLLFGTPAEDAAAALQTLDYVVAHREAIGFLNLAIFNLPLGSPDAAHLEVSDFYPGDLAFYGDFRHPRGWDRGAVRQFIDKQFKRHPVVQAILRRDPPVFTSNHAPFFLCQREESR
ncbi:MAG: radical SAM protein [Desulfatitalea sp.]|nr:radical SAM protein [Desulfatitalea sp.]